MYPSSTGILFKQEPCLLKLFWKHDGLCTCLRIQTALGAAPIKHLLLSLA